MKLLSGTIEETILIQLLQKGASSTSELQEHAFRRHQCTKQGFYRALRKLKADEKIVVYKSTVSVSNLWRDRLARLLEGETGSAIGDPTKLEAGDSLVLKMKGLSNIDRLWAHLFTAIERKTPAKHPLYLYNPHNWSALLRTEIDREHEARLKDAGRPAFLVIGSDSLMDKAATQEARFEHLEYSFNPKVKSPAYVAAIDDYVIELRLAPSARAELDTIFKRNDIAAAQKVLRAMDEGAHCQIIIEKSPQKAGEWKRRLAKDFLIPKKFRDF